MASKKRSKHTKKVAKAKSLGAIKPLAQAANFKHKIQ
jgi:hypothetical protein